MKNMRFIYGTLLVCLTSSVVLAQGKFGPDSADCVRNLSFYRDYSRQNNFKEALPFWREAMHFCPAAASQNLYIDGVKIMKYVIDNTTEATLRQKRIDSLLMLYDRRIENFKVNKGSVYAFKAYDVMNYVEDKGAVYKAFEDAVMAGGNQAEAHTMISSIQAAINAYNDRLLTADKVIDFYNKLIGFVDMQQKAKPNDEQVSKLALDLENLFMTSGVASCDNLVAMFESDFKANPENKDLIVRIVQMMSMNDCTKNDLYYQAVEAYHKLDPSIGSAYALGRMYLAKGEPAKAVEYYKQAINYEDIPESDKLKYLRELGTIYLRELNNPSQAAIAVRQAIQVDPQDGTAYLLMGSIWAAQKCSGDEIAQKAAFWVSVDYFTKAKSIDPTLADEANRFINNYTQYFPQQADAFMYDLVDGNPYTVNCNGITEQTRVRTRK